MAERITWTMSKPFYWEGNVGDQTMFALKSFTNELFTLERSSSFGIKEIARGLEVSSLKAMAEAMLEKLIDQGLPLE